MARPSTNGRTGGVLELQAGAIRPGYRPTRQTEPGLTPACTKKGDALTEGPLGVVPDGCVFAATHHKDGFDSRYSHIGFVCRDRLVGTGVAIL